jgi:hypothetical protein
MSGKREAVVGFSAHLNLCMTESAMTIGVVSAAFHFRHT